MEKRSTPRVVSALTARTQLTQIMRRAKKGRERFVVDQGGEPQVVIMGIEDFLDSTAIWPPESVITVRGALAGNEAANCAINSGLSAPLMWSWSMESA